VQRRQRAAWGDFEDRTLVVGPAPLRCPVEVSIAGLDLPRLARLRVALLLAQLLKEQTDRFNPAMEVRNVKLLVGSM
jgi:hypothetical protein